MDMSKQERRAAFTAAAAQTTQHAGRFPLSERVKSVPLFLRDTMNGTYKGTSKGKLFAYALAFLYLLSPIDLVPEAFLTIFGVFDDMAVAVWLFASLNIDTETYLETVTLTEPAPRSEPNVINVEVIR